jgi:hypothetical protein
VLVWALLLTARENDAAGIRYNASGQPGRWNLEKPSASVSTNVVNPKTKAIRFFLGSDTASSDNRTAELNAILASFAQWQSVPGTSLKFEQGGLLDPPVDINLHDQTNMVFWAKRTTLVNGGLDDISGTLGFTYYRFANDGFLLEADIVLNGAQYYWFTDFNLTHSESQFVESVALHEIGHFIGLDHSPVGGATMLCRGLPGVNVQAGLSSDEVCAACFLYPKAGVLAGLSTLQGTVFRQNTGIGGAVVCIEDSAGNLIAGTVTQADGKYVLPALPPGNYQAHVAPLDPPASISTRYLLRGIDISSDLPFSPVTDFHPTTNVPVVLTAGNAKSLNFSVTAGEPAFRITWLRPPTTDPSYLPAINVPVQVSPGTPLVYVGVYGPNLPSGGATLTLSGDGLVVGPTEFMPTTLAGMNVLSLSVTLSVASNATPGLRTFTVRSGNDLAYANGFLEITPPIPDFNFDGLDDRFQRQYFSLFTSAEADPLADPDQDGFSNQAEYWSGTNPLDPLSLLKINRIVKLNGAIQISWQSQPGKRYQLWNRPSVDEPWITSGPPITATSNWVYATEAPDNPAARLYRIQAIP